MSYHMRRNDRKIAEWSAIEELFTAANAPPLLPKKAMLCAFTSCQGLVGMPLFRITNYLR